VTTLDLGADLAIYLTRLVRLIRSAPEHPAGARVLSILDERGPLGITALARIDGCSQPTMSAQVAQLADRGWVAKTRNPEDARGSVIALTDAGRDALADVRRRVSATLRDRLAAAGRTDADLAETVALLRDLVEADTDSPLERTR